MGSELHDIDAVTCSQWRQEWDIGTELCFSPIQEIGGFKSHKLNDRNLTVLESSIFTTHITTSFLWLVLLFRVRLSHHVETDLFVNHLFLKVSRQLRMVVKNILSASQCA